MCQGVLDWYPLVLECGIDYFVELRGKTTHTCYKLNTTTNVRQCQRQLTNMNVSLSKLNQQSTKSTTLSVKSIIIIITTKKLCNTAFNKIQTANNKIFAVNSY